MATQIQIRRELKDASAISTEDKSQGVLCVPTLTQASPVDAYFAELATRQKAFDEAAQEAHRELYTMARATAHGLGNKRPSNGLLDGAGITSAQYQQSVQREKDRLAAAEFFMRGEAATGAGIKKRFREIQSNVKRAKQNVQPAQQELDEDKTAPQHQNFKALAQAVDTAKAVLAEAERMNHHATKAMGTLQRSSPHSPAVLNANEVGAQLKRISEHALHLRNELEREQQRNAGLISTTTKQIAQAERELKLWKSAQRSKHVERKNQVEKWTRQLTKLKATLREAEGRIAAMQSDYQEAKQVQAKAQQDYNAAADDMLVP